MHFVEICVMHSFEDYNSDSKIIIYYVIRAYTKL